MKYAQSMQLDLTRLEAASSQNPARTTPAGLKTLIAAMKEAGQLSPILVKRIKPKSGKRVHYVIADGHRRVAAARALGWKTVAAVQYSGSLSVSELWAEANGATRSVKGADWFYGWAREETDAGDPKAFLKTMPVATANHIRGFVRVFGKKRAIEVGLQGTVAPVIHSFVSLVFNALQTRMGDDCKVRRIDVGEWMLKHGSAVRKLIVTHPPVRILKKLHTRVKRGDPFPLSEWV